MELQTATAAAVVQTETASKNARVAVLQDLETERPGP
jgi:hypothetical protein